MNALITAMAGITRDVIEWERTAARGRALGLDEREVCEVRDVWAAWHRARPTPLSWDVVREDLGRRAAGEPWGPEAAHGRYLASLFAPLLPSEPIGLVRAAARRTRLRRIHTAYPARRMRRR